MDPTTGRLRALSEEESSVMSLIEKGSKLSSKEQAVAETLEGFESLPENLHQDAQKELNGLKETIVDLNTQTPLAQWARKKRKEKKVSKKKIRRKMAQHSRKMNRKKKR